MPLILALLLLAGCAAPSGLWVVRGGSPADRAQAVALVEAAKAVLPDGRGYLAGGGQINLRPDLTGQCYVRPPAIATGCIGGGVWVLWPHPGCPAGADLTCSALAHELAHLGLVTDDNGRADACALLVNLEYRRSLP